MKIEMLAYSRELAICTFITLTFVAQIPAYMRSVFNKTNQFHPTSKGRSCLFVLLVNNSTPFLLTLQKERDLAHSNEK